MKVSYRLFSGFTVLISAILLNSCDKSYSNYVTVDKDANNVSMVQVFCATVTAANRNVILIDGKRVSRPTLGAGLSFPTAVYPSTNTGYSFAVPGGLKAFIIQDTLISTLQKPLVFTTNMEVGKNYTIFTYDSIISPKQITVETVIEKPIDNTARLRFANLIHDVNAVPAVEVYSRRRNEVIFANINKTDVTGFIPYSSTVSDTLDVRPAGTVGNTTFLARFIGFLPTQKRGYTLVYRGSHRGTKVATVFANY